MSTVAGWGVGWQPYLGAPRASHTPGRPGMEGAGCVGTSLKLRWFNWPNHFSPGTAH